MNPNPDDQNNHVPPISPVDNWDDLDESTERSRIGLPPKRVEGRLPPKKEFPAAKVNDTARMSEPETDAENALQQDDSKKPGKTSRKPRMKPARKDEEKAAVTAGSDNPPEGSLEFAVILPHVKGGKHRRVNEINPPVDRSAARPAGIIAKVPAAETGEEAEPILQKRRRFSRGERADWGITQGRTSLKWILLAGLGVLSLVIMAVVISQRPGKASKRKDDKSLYSKLAPAEDDMLAKSKGGVAKAGAEIFEQLSNSRSLAESIFVAYASAQSPGDFIKLVHAPERNRELIESVWKPLGMKPGWSPGGEPTWRVIEGEQVPYAILEGVLGDFSTFSAYFRQNAGELKMDWKATSVYSSADFSDLKAGKGDGSEVRAWLSNVDFYTFSFPEAKYRSFRVMSPKGDTIIWGYVPRGAELEKELLKLFQPGEITGAAQSEIQAILRIAPGEGDSLPDQWLISSIVRLGWLDE